MTHDAQPVAQDDPHEIMRKAMESIGQHRDLYLTSGGAEGHLTDLGNQQAPGLIPTLLLKTIGRRSGTAHYAPLIYGVYGDGVSGKDWVVVGSKGGVPKHPDWFLNLQAADTVEFQVATQAFRGTAREAQGEERARVWEYMTIIYPPYADYEQFTESKRIIPVVMLRPQEPIPTFTP